MDWEAAIERQSDALARILLALAAMAGLLESTRCRLPPHVYRALLGPLRALEAAAERPFETLGPDPAAVQRLRLRLMLLLRVIGNLMRWLLTPAPRPEPTPEFRPSIVDLQGRANRAAGYPDTS